MGTIYRRQDLFRMMILFLADRDLEVGYCIFLAYCMIIYDVSCVYNVFCLNFSGNIMIPGSGTEQLQVDCNTFFIRI
jgi:hypothetical protein